MLFYDFEVFLKDWLVVVIDVINRNEHVIVNDKKALELLYNNHKNDIWIGFNSRHYDQYILKSILCGFNPKEVNDFIIEKKNQGWQFSNQFRNIPLNNYDVKQGQEEALKLFEGFMGNDIKESSVPFDIDRKLTNEEIEETIKYCRHDVEQTIEVFLRRKSEFDTMMYFIKHFNLPLCDINKTKAQLTAKILGGNRIMFDDEFQFPIVNCLRLDKYQHIANWYKDPSNHDYSKRQENIIASVPHVNSWGGGHGALEKYHAKGIFLMIDVTAYYPSLQQRFEFGKRVMNYPQNFEFIHNSNIEFKRKGDKKKRQPFKILDNAISGQMKQKSSALYDPMSNNAICINGQLLLIDLIEKLEPYVDLIQNNTDGICVKLRNYDDFELIDDIVFEWESRTGMKMDIDQFHGEMFQKDVNNYVLVDKETGAIKRKGAYVKQLSELDYDLPIVNKAIVEYMVHDTPIEQTIMNCNELKEFQQVKKIGSKYLYLLHGGKRLNEKCVRCFASTSPNDGDLKKVNANTHRQEKVENTPLKCFLFNSSVNGVKCPSKLDKQWYIDLAKKRLKDYGVI